MPGKSTILEAVKAMLGAYAIATEAESFCKKRFGGAVRNDIVRLRGKRIALCSEVEEGKEFDVALLNSLIAGDTQTARELYHEFIEFAPQFKLLFAANSRPKVPSGAEALWRRIDQIPFTNSHKGKTNESIKEHLTRDPVARSALLAWAVQGCLDWQRERLATPEAVQRYTEEYRAENEPIQAWIDEACKQGKREKCLAKPLLESFNEWASENGEEWATAKSLAKELTRLGFKREHTENGAAWKGLALV